MFRFLLFGLLSALLLTAVNADPVKDELPVAIDDWPWWRGPNRDGVADPKQQPPRSWSDSENVVWKAAIPGRGHGSPTVVGRYVYLATADEKEQVQSVLCYERDTGKLSWQTPVHKGNFVKGGNSKSSHASSTVCCDGQRLYINFANNAAVFTTALSLDGKVLWQTKVTPYVLHQGFGSSPAVYRSLVLVAADNKGGGAVAGLERTTGKIVWKVDRPKTPNYASPIVLNVAGRDQLLLTGCDLVTSLDPLTGNKNWEIKGSTTECVTSTVTDGEHIYTSGGFPKNHLAAVRADGSSKVAWQNGTRVYVPSMLADKGYLYAVLDAGFAVCWKADTGKELWRGRLGGEFSASPIRVGEVIYATNEAGTTFLFKSSGDHFELLGKNQLGQQVLATPTICGGRIYMRVATTEKGKRQETLYCLGTNK